MTLLLLILAAICVLTPFAVAHRLGTIPLFSPLHILSYFAFFGVFLKTFYMAVLDGNMFMYSFNLPVWAVLDGYLFITAFILSICLGYVLSCGRVWKVQPDIRIEHAIQQIRYPRFLVMLSFAAALLVTLEMLNARGFRGIGAAFTFAALDVLSSTKILRIEGIEGFGASNAALKQLLFIPSLTLAIFIARWTIWRKKEDLVWLLILTGLEVYLAILQGKRFSLVGTLALFMIIPSILGKRFSATTFFKATIAFLALFSIFIVMTSLREHTLNRKGSLFNVQPAINHILGSTYFLDINVPILIISLSNKDDRFYGASYFYWTYAWIPRAVWPEKPVVTLGPHVKQEVLGMYGTIGGINPTGPGEAFLNFGWMGAFMGLFLGWFYRRIEKLLIASTQFAHRYGIWIYATVGFSLISGTIQSSFAGAITSAAVKSLAIILLITLVRRVTFYKVARLT